MTNETTKIKCILNPKIAKQLIRAGHKLVDIKANKSNPDKTVFMFEVSPEFQSAMAKLSGGKKSSERIEDGAEIMVNNKVFRVGCFDNDDNCVVLKGEFVDG